MRHGAALALLLLALLAAPCARAVPPPAALVPRRALAQAPGPQPQPLEAQIIRPEQAYKTPAKDLVAVPSTAVDVPPLNVTAARAPTIEDCSARCRQAPGCQWFWYCSSAEGCWDGADSTVAYQQCVLRGQGVKAQCRLPPLARSSSSQELVTSGFPTSSVLNSGTFKFTELQGQGIEGGDFPCEMSSVPGKCVLPIVGEAVLLCHALPNICKSVVTYDRGFDGCSAMAMGVLKNVAPLPDNSFVSPGVSTLINFEPPARYPFFLYEDEAMVQVPTAAEMEANKASLAENGTAWWGCASGRCVASGDDVAVLDNVPSAEACCRACAARYDGTPVAQETGQPCNAWNWCSREQGCSFSGSAEAPTPVRLGFQQCQLRYAYLSNATFGSPLFVGTKGNASEFSCGAPLGFWAPEKPGFKKMPGRGLFLYGRYNCTPSLRPGWDCAPLGDDLDELLEGCLDDPQCLSMPIKQALPPEYGLPTNTSKYRGFRKNDATKLLIVPTTNLYVPEGRAAPGSNSTASTNGASSGSSSSSSSSSLSTGAIVGIAVGAAAAAAVAAGIAWAALRQRRRRLSAAEAAKGAALENGKAGAQLLDPASSGSSHLGNKGGSVAGSSPPLSAVGIASAQPGLRSPSSPGLTSPGASMEGAPLAELLERVASVEAAASTLGSRTIPSEHVLLSAETLPPRLREFLVPPSAVSYCRWPNGQPQEIGAGATGRVFKAMLNGEIVAAKEIDLVSSKINQEAFITEALRLQQLRHPNVVALMGIALAPSKGVLLLEYCEGRDLHAALDVVAHGTRERLFGWHRRGRRVALEVAKALNYLHSKGIVHLDVKSPNVLLTSNGTAKLADVGFSREKLHTFLSEVPNVGTFAWAAPEILLGAQQCTMAVDVYSFGVLLWEIITGQRPQRGQMRMPRVPEECPQAACDLMVDCLNQDPAKRPTAPQLLQRLGQLAARPNRLPPVAMAAPAGNNNEGSGSSKGTGGGSPNTPRMRVAVKQPAMPSPFAAAAAAAPPFAAVPPAAPSPFAAAAAAPSAVRSPFAAAAAVAPPFGAAAGRAPGGAPEQ